MFAILAYVFILITPIIFSSILYYGHKCSTYCNQKSNICELTKVSLPVKEFLPGDKIILNTTYWAINIVNTTERYILGKVDSNTSHFREGYITCYTFNDSAPVTYCKCPE